MNRFCVFATLVVSVVSATVVAQELPKLPTLEKAMLGSTANLHAFGRTLLCGQPSPEDFAEAKSRGIKTVISLREEGEASWDEPGMLMDLGLAFYRCGFRSPESLTDEIFDESLKLLADSKKLPVMLHCSSGNRVGAIWFAHRVLNDGITIDAAQDEAKRVGLQTAAYEEIALAYINDRSSVYAKASIQTGINDRFIDPDLDISEWLGRFEIESREVYAAREFVLGACDIKPGFSVADIGAGTGFYSRLFASAVGDKGWVYAIDISPRFLEHINQKSQASGVTNVTSVLASDRSVRLPPNSIDVAFICDTYHHFEYPQSTLASILSALKPGGTLVVIDFQRIPGKSREFILGHVRAGKEVFQGEVIDAGFRFVEEIDVPGFKENYFLRFRKPGFESSSRRLR